MDISQLRGLASVSPARAAQVEGQVPGQGRERERLSSRLDGQWGWNLFRENLGAGAPTSKE